jgi:protein-S-isoprenylcysteine O-methyltransferase Ste14
VTSILVFRRVRSDYLSRGQLRPLSTFLEFVVFALHGFASYVFLDSNLGHIDRDSVLFPVAMVLMTVGLVLVVMAMARLGFGKSCGGQATRLQHSGLYRYTRNPQIVAYLLFVGGYALLWPSWSGLLWVILYVAIAHIMIRTEEEHLRRVFGETYEHYCATTPRYLGIPKAQGGRERS